ncbi:MAG: TIGR02757 family protein [Bacteroidales bacterium]|nr:TIGR02757 family protein [Bacteroidales bacterium]
MDALLKDRLRQWADTYNNPEYFREDPIAFPREFASRGAGLKDIEIAAVFAAHFAWGRRSMIVRDCTRLFDEMGWRPYDYVMKGCWRCDAASAHRTVRWSEVASICARLKEYYSGYDSLERLDTGQIRTGVYRQKEDPKAANKKINMMRRWMVRRDGKVDLGLWKDTDPATLVIPLDVHVYQEAEALGLTDRRQKDLRTAVQITDAFREIWPADPCLGDFALFGYGINK